MPAKVKRRRPRPRTSRPLGTLCAPCPPQGGGLDLMMTFGLGMLASLAAGVLIELGRPPAK